MGSRGGRGSSGGIEQPASAGCEWREGSRGMWGRRLRGRWRAILLACLLPTPSPHLGSVIKLHLTTNLSPPLSLSHDYSLKAKAGLGLPSDVLDSTNGTPWQGGGGCPFAACNLARFNSHLPLPPIKTLIKAPCKKVRGVQRRQSDTFGGQNTIRRRGQTEGVGNCSEFWRCGAEQRSIPKVDGGWLQKSTAILHHGRGT